VQTKYRDKNTFGGVVRGSVIAKISLNGQILEIVNQE
jgi:hypothetical protein